MSIYPTHSRRRSALGGWAKSCLSSPSPSSCHRSCGRSWMLSLAPTSSGTRRWPRGVLRQPVFLVFLYDKH
jgi:hypothetical protein